ncbi:MAG: hypothetical protein IJ242_11375 [Clostridia bacterium]|nr:hypothetical protein [Clostridia bacterium]
MGKFTDLLFSILLGWVRTLADAVWAIFTSDRDSVLEWLGKYWIPVCLILVAVGLAGDWLIWLIRWRPFHSWSVKAREKLGISEEAIAQMNAEQVGVDQAAALMAEDAPDEPIKPEPAVSDETAEDVMRRAASYSDRELGEYPGMRYEPVAPSDDTLKYSRPAGQEDEQTRYQRELQEYAVKQAQYERDLAEWNRMQAAEKQAKYEQEMEEYRNKRAKYALDMAAYERDLAEYERAHSGQQQEAAVNPEDNAASGRKRRRNGENT